MAALPSLTDDDKSLIFCMAYHIDDVMCPRKFTSPHRLSEDPPPVGDMTDTFLVLGAMRDSVERPAPDKLEQLQVVYRPLFEKLAEIWGKVSEAAAARTRDRITDIISSVYPSRVVAASALWHISHEILSPTQQIPISIRSDGIPGLRVSERIGVWFNASDCSIRCWKDGRPLTTLTLFARPDDVVSLMLLVSRELIRTDEFLHGMKIRTKRRPWKK